MPEDDRPTGAEIEAFNRLQFFIRDGMPSNWLGLAEELRDASETLWDDRDSLMRLQATLSSDRQIESKPLTFFAHSRPYVLLIGFCLENLIKGVAVARDPSHISSGKLSKELKSHSVSSLIEDIGFVPEDANEISLLTLLDEAIPYWGRYPIPLTSSRVTPEGMVTPELRTAFHRLFERLSSKIIELTKGGWDSGAGPREVSWEEWAGENEN